MKRIPKTHTVFGVKCHKTITQKFAPSQTFYNGYNSRNNFYIEILCDSMSNNIFVKLHVKNVTFSHCASSLKECEREIYIQFSKYAMSVDETLYALYNSMR